MKKKISQLNISLTGPTLFWVATMVSNMFNWLYNLQAGRTLTKEQFGVLSVFLSFQYLASVPSNALSTTVSRFTAYYSGKGEKQKHFYFFRQYWWLSWVAGAFAMLLAIVFREAIERFFGIDTSF